METNKEKLNECCGNCISCYEIGPYDFDSDCRDVDCHCHKPLEPQVDKQQEIRKEFKEWFFGTNAKFSKNEEMTDIADWWLNKLSQAIEQEREAHRKELVNITTDIDKSRKRVVSREHYPQITENKIHDREIYNQAIDDVLQIIDSKLNV